MEYRIYIPGLKKLIVKYQKLSDDDHAAKSNVQFGREAWMETRNYRETIATTKVIDILEIESQDR